jgi:phosphoglycolate phosphatase-like HAD superfamily hydrolase
VAVARAEALTGRRYAGKDVVVVGDAPADVECGAALGVTAIAVATGRHTVAELAALGPDHVFADLSDWQAAYRAIMGEGAAEG